ncbi:hypothetical protein [Aliikangiella coralliicola]|uniref:Uncharacterized protein n=1 Tax=Aliikangiella coralliicola TaxID=2592383 RepID=A0A545UA73_9GAMM|nr:hypothetical protein [Aliikangiella coralliicola]TQV86339.1 hypothetical protein FLL46_15550 [Aliikangiella coralliicola]
MKIFICKLHVIIKYVGGNSKSERYFPILFMAFWLNIVGQSFIYLTYLYFIKDLIRVEISYATLKVIAIGIAILSVVVLYSLVNDDEIYGNAEDWFQSKDPGEKLRMKFALGIILFSVFFGALIWMLYKL